MADRLEFDVVLDGTQAEALIRTLTSDLETGLRQAGQELGQSLDFSQAIASARTLSDTLTSGLTGASEAFNQALNFDSAVTAAQTIGDTLVTNMDAGATAAQSVADALNVNTTPIESISVFLDEAANSADVIATAGDNIDTTGASDLAVAMGAGEENARSLAGALQEASQAAAETSLNTRDLAGNVAEASTASGELAQTLAESANAGDRAAAAEEGVHQAVRKTHVAHQANNEELEKGNAQLEKGTGLAEKLKERFESITGRNIEALGPFAKTFESITEGFREFGTVGELVAGGTVAGLTAMTAAGEKWESVQNVITRTTGATGSQLEDFSGSFAKIAGQSERAPEDLAKIFGVLNGQTQLTGKGLEDLTASTDKFLKATGGGVSDVRTLTQAAAALGVSADGIPLLMDQMAAASARFGTNISTLLPAVRQTAPALKSFGFDPGQIVGLNAQLESVGLPLRRISNGFVTINKLAKEQGITGAEFFAKMIENIKSADNNVAASVFTKGIFSGTAATGFIAAVRDGRISMESLNEVMADAPGKSKAMADQLTTVGDVLRKIKNDLTTTLGPGGGLDIVDGLKTSLAGISPFFHQLGQAVAGLAPLFRGFAEGGVTPVVLGFKALTPVLQFTSAVLSKIPDPLKEVFGALLLFRGLNQLGLFTAILNGFKAVGSAAVTAALTIAGAAQAAAVDAAAAGAGTIGRAFAGVRGGAGALTGAISAVTGGFSLANVAFLAAGAGLVTYMVLQRKAAEEAKLHREAVEELNKSLGKTSVDSIEGRKKLIGFLDAGSAGKLISDQDLKTARDLGVSNTTFLQNAIENLDKSKPKNGLLKDAVETDARVLEAAKPAFLNSIAAQVNLGATEKENLRVKLESAQSQTELNKILNEDPRLKAAGGQAAFERFLQLNKDNLGLTHGLEGASDSATKSLKDFTREQINNVKLSGDAGAALVEQARVTLGLTDIEDNLGAVYNEVLRVQSDKILKDHQVTVATQESAEATERLKEKTAEFLTGLDAAGTSTEKLAVAEAHRLQLLPQIIELERDGKLNDQDRVTLNQALGVGGEDIAKAEKRLAEIRADLTGNTTQLGLAQQIYFAQINRGADPVRALGFAARSTGVDADELFKSIKQVKDQTLSQFVPAVKATDAALSVVERDFHDGASAEKVWADALNASNNDIGKAKAALDQYKESLDKTKKGLLDMIQPVSDTAKAFDEFNKSFLPKEVTPAHPENPIDVALNRETTAIQLNTTAQVRRAQTTRDNIAVQRDQAEAFARNQGVAFDPKPFNVMIDGWDREIKRLEGVGKDAEADAERNAKRVKAQPTTLGQLLGTQSIELAATRVDINTANRLRNELGAGALVDFIFNPDNNFTKEQKRKFLKDAVTATPQELQQLEQDAKNTNADLQRTTEEAAKAGGLFLKDINPNFVKLNEDQGVENGKALGKGLAKGFVESHATEFITAALKGGLTIEEIKKAFPELFPEPKKVVPPTIQDFITADSAILSGKGPAPETTGFPVSGADARAAFDHTFALTPMAASDAATLGIKLDENLIPVADESGRKFGANTAEAFKGEISARFSVPLPSTDLDNLLAQVTGVAHARGITIGEAIDAGVAEGILRNNKATDAAFTMAHNANGEIVTTLGITSPSKVTMAHGKYFVEGFAQGINDHAHKATMAASQMASDLQAVLGGTMGSPKILASVTAKSEVALGDGPGVERIVRAIGANRPVHPNSRRRLPFGGQV